MYAVLAKFRIWCFLVGPIAGSAKFDGGSLCFYLVLDDEASRHFL